MLNCDRNANSSQISIGKCANQLMQVRARENVFSEIYRL